MCRYDVAVAYRCRGTNGVGVHRRVPYDSDVVLIPPVKNDEAIEATIDRFNGSVPESNALCARRPADWRGVCRNDDGVRGNRKCS